tara:strand:+ start:2033 stop:2335 length:303 start_codon:yes stop_codon:yes gene_type:complete
VGDMRNYLFILFITLFLNSCAQTTAVLGPALTVGASGGNIYKAGFQYGANEIMKKKTGKSATDHAFTYVNNEKEKKLRKEELKNLLESHIISSRQKIFKK